MIVQSIRSLTQKFKFEYFFDLENRRERFPRERERDRESRDFHKFHHNIFLTDTFFLIENFSFKFLREREREKRDFEKT